MEIVVGVKLTAPPLHRLWYIFLVRRVALIQSGNVQSIKTYCIVLPDSLDGKCIHSTMHQATPALSGDVSIYPLTTALSLMRIHMKRVEKTGIFHRTTFSAQFRIWSSTLLTCQLSKALACKFIVLTQTSSSQPGYWTKQYSFWNEIRSHDEAARRAYECPSLTYRSLWRMPVVDSCRT